jgi:phosphatidylserine decarboxylase
MGMFASIYLSILNVHVQMANPAKMNRIYDFM